MTLDERRAQARTLLETELRLTLGEFDRKRFDAIWAEVPNYETHRTAVYGLLSRKRIMLFDFAEYETMVRNLAVRTKNHMAVLGH